ncbi:TPA: hypothetical protein SAY52_004285 [Burkholderia cenocepacia]|uniref:hypothetical protein n=1 Tax=unclassified Burkholderia TaxID=2613784 RepID=UPI00158A6D7E|nr:MULTISPECIES: hypothetical protein [unclassified Burkholderia]HEF5873629.1 hypothetical protein [Burkholderia cenocepacia]
MPTSTPCRDKRGHSKSVRFPAPHLDPAPRARLDRRRDALKTGRRYVVYEIFKTKIRACPIPLRRRSGKNLAFGRHSLLKMRRCIDGPAPLTPENGLQENEIRSDENQNDAG